MIITEPITVARNVVLSKSSRKQQSSFSLGVNELSNFTDINAGTMSSSLPVRHP